MRRIGYLVICWVGALTLSAQTYFSRQIEELAKQVTAQCSLPTASQRFVCAKIPYPLVIRYNALQQVEHLGIELFQSDEQDYFGHVICDFHERLFLELYGLTDIGIHERGEEYSLRWEVRALTGSELLSKKDLNRLVAFIREEAEGYTLVKDSLRWTSVWKAGEQSISLEFPATFSLIYGIDKKEADDWFEQQMLALQTPRKRQQLEIRPAEFFLAKNGLWVQPGNYKYTRALNNDIYFAADATGGYRLVDDSHYPVESVINLFLQPGEKAKKMELSLLHHAYGGQKKQYSVSLYDFLLSLQNEYDAYIGFEKWEKEKEKMLLTVLFHNREFNSHHMLYIQVAPQVIEQGEGEIKGQLYTYIPNHNIRNLYKEYEEGEPYTNYMEKK
ncbi:hypothetical protein M2480_002403 [Parabacteroides sp. PFB2-12]|uniref:hypothetical protein n=1 Tax=unclassified Parabacteroides TaxID=2649774 RepID=UPI00247704A8|nr:MULTISPECIES: hypothetical protein [unclassified Parabacteroides]MDH6343611.1 hypothetical protein [Parabacteroides sp. PM6-13]MDH6391408.1 hypothetical protein [Parabacteroides sp. PFB2-12]